MRANRAFNSHRSSNQKLSLRRPCHLTRKGVINRRPRQSLTIIIFRTVTSVHLTTVITPITQITIRLGCPLRSLISRYRNTQATPKVVVIKVRVQISLIKIRPNRLVHTRYLRHNLHPYSKKGRRFARLAIRRRRNMRVVRAHTHSMPIVADNRTYLSIRRRVLVTVSSQVVTLTPRRVVHANVSNRTAKTRGTRLFIRAPMKLTRQRKSSLPRSDSRDARTAPHPQGNLDRPGRIRLVSLLRGDTRPPQVRPDRATSSVVGPPCRRSENAHQSVGAAAEGARAPAGRGAHTSAEPM